MKIIVTIANQTLTLLDDNHQLQAEYSVSTGKNGMGQEFGSEKTPLGKHVICEKIGADAPENAVFVARVWTDEVYTPELAKAFPERDWILTRILRLQGLEPGFNEGGNVDTKRRCVYIHGVPEVEPMGVPLSHGCIRMRNQDIMALFEKVDVDTEVIIKADNQ